MTDFSRLQLCKVKNLNRKLVFLMVGVQLLLATAVLANVQVRIAEALVPSIVSVSSHDVGPTTMLDVVVNHQPPPAIGSSHYVSTVQLQINGTTVDLPQTPQSTETFTVHYSLGSNSNSYSVVARAFCIVHGYSAFSSAVAVPESTNLILVMALTAVTVVIAAKTLGRRASAGVLR
jgi:hypothetical protein